MEERECKKIKFETIQLAEDELRRIVENNDWRIWKQKSPHRLYYCKYCLSYHLTSSIKIKSY